MSGDVWRLALTSIKATWKQSGLLVCFGLIAPQLALNLWLDHTSFPVVDELRALFTSKGGTSGSPLMFSELIRPAAQYFWRIGPAVVIATLICLASYLGLIQTSVDYLRNQSPRGATAAWLQGLKRALVAIISMFLLAFFVTAAGQIVMVPAILIGVLGLMIPTILICEGKGMIYALRSALLLRYVRGTKISGWSVIFNMMSIGAFLYGTMAAVGLSAELLLGLDEVIGLPSLIWIASTPGSPTTSIIYIAVSNLETIMSMAFLSVLPSLTTSLYVIVRRDDAGRTIAQA